LAGNLLDSNIVWKLEDNIQDSEVFSKDWEIEGWAIQVAISVDDASPLLAGDSTLPMVMRGGTPEE
jgi:hypothetical protein